MFLKSLKLWIDPVARTGPESMAIDEWLLSLYQEPILRVYRWKGEWGSIGYFDRLSQAQEALPGLEWVRRWTGGGTVDHRKDWAYTLIVPFSAMGDRRIAGGDTYRDIHEALAVALEPEGLDASLSCGNLSTGASTCFDNPVSHDLIDSTGTKIAGAGQRRSSTAMMHQGSVALPLEDDEASKARSERFAAALADSWSHWTLEPPKERLMMAVRQQYGNPEWTQRRM